MAFCQNCGCELEPGSAFCPKCSTGILDKTARAGGYQVSIQERKISTCVILSIVTFGIYGLVWLFHLVSDINTACPSSDDQTPGTVLLLSIVTCGIYGIYWNYKAGEKVDKIRMRNGEAPASSSLIYMILSIFGLGIVASCILQSELNKVAGISAK